MEHSLQSNIEHFANEHIKYTEEETEDYDHTSTIFYDDEDINNILNIKISDTEQHIIRLEITNIIKKIYEYYFEKFKDDINKFVNKDYVTISYK